jgi:hypothetical protein
MAVGLVVLLLVAAWLKPSPTGIGTHRQLGLPPCTAVLLWGKPCPACGMTTSWAWFMRGRWGASLQANPGGFFLAISSLIGVVFCSRAAIRAQPIGEPSLKILLVALLIALVASIAQWVWRLCES